MPYPESCPECGGIFRNTGTHFTARRNEVGRHVLLELGCQNTTRRFWWDFTTGSPTEDGQTIPARRVSHLAASVEAAAATNGSHHAETNGHLAVSTLDLPEQTPEEVTVNFTDVEPIEVDAEVDKTLTTPTPTPEAVEAEAVQPIAVEPLAAVELPGPPPATGAAPALKDAFVRQLQLDRLTLRQMRSWLMSDEARRAIEVAAGATEATYERLALILFGVDLPQLLGKQTAVQPSTGISAEERLELQREKARIRARLRRAAAKAARQPA